MTSLHSLSLPLLALALGCAAPRPALQPARPARLTGLPADSLATMPVPDPAADRENQDRRFGVDSARERGETAKRKREEQRRCVDVVANGGATGSTKPPCPPSAR
jgi:hypothetical protein